MIFACEILLAAAFALPGSSAVRPILAYIDPGAGSLIIQVVLGSALASLLAIKLYWRQLKGLVAALMRRKSDRADQAESDSQRREGDSGD